MDKYEGMQAATLMRKLFDLGKNKRSVFAAEDQQEYDDIVAAIQRSVIRERTVGTVQFSVGWEPDGDGDDRETEEFSADGEYLYNVRYALVPVKTPEEDEDDDADDVLSEQEHLYNNDIRESIERETSRYNND